MLSSEPMEKSLEALGTQMLVVEVQGKTLMSEKEPGGTKQDGSTKGKDVSADYKY